MTSQKGFTIIEIMIVVVVIMILMTLILTPRNSGNKYLYQKCLDKAIFEHKQSADQAEVNCGRIYKN